MNSIDTSVIAAKAYSLKIQIKELEKQHEALMSELKKSFNLGVDTFGNYKLVMTERPANINYAKLLEDYEISNADYYRTGTIKSFKLEFMGE